MSVEAPAEHLRGTQLAQAGQFSEALSCFETALGSTPADPLLLFHRAMALQSMGRQREAVEAFEYSLACNPFNAATWLFCAISLRFLGHFERAIDCLVRAYVLDPTYDCVPGELLFAGMCICDWSRFELLKPAVLAEVASGGRSSMPMAIQAITDDPAVQLATAQQMVTAAPAPALAPERPYGHARLRIGYLSAHFSDAVLARLLTGLLEQHDRTRFEVCLLSLAPADLKSTYGVRCIAGVDQFADLSRMTDQQAAECIRALEVDVLVDCIGYVQGYRPSLLARRPAPVQLNYLGYIGSIGPHHDYIVADRYVIPESERAHYAERVLYLPECYQANDDKRAHPDPTPRTALGLPEDALVLCSFNNTYKLSPEVFTIWCRLLAAHSHAVLWLYAPSLIVERNLRSEAQRRGIDPARLVFAAKAPYAAYLARLGAADLFLDTFPYNSGATASDALWMGLPVLTCSGRAFASRMAGSLLTTLGLPELITGDLAEYERRALELLEHPAQIAALRARLEGARSTSPLFDTARFTRHFEAALSGICQRFEVAA